MSRQLVVVAALAVLLPSVSAQGLTGLEPFLFTGDLIVTDRSSTAENLRRLIDLNLDGDCNDAGEVVEFYNGLSGPFALSNESGVTVGADGTVYVCDSTTDIILALFDLNGDGDAMDAGEAQVWFNGNPGMNGSSVVMSSAQDMVIDAAGTIWVANAATTSGNDAILRLADNGGTFGANDPGEASEYASFGNGSALPTDLAIGPGGFLYFLETGTAGTMPKGVHRLHDDVVPNGHCNDAGEVSPFWVPGLASGSLFAMAVDVGGWFYVSDYLGDTIRALRDLNADLTITLGGAEDTLYWSPGASLVWSLACGSDGALYAAESQAPDRILRISDSVIPNGNALDPGETVEVYNNTVSPVLIGDPFAIAHLRRPTLTLGGTPSVSNPFQVIVRATTGHFLSVWVSTGGFQNTPIPPFGILALSLTPADTYFELFAGFAPPGGVFSMTVPALNDPLLVGFTIHAQGYAGFPSRLEFTNPLVVTFLP